MVWYCIAKCGVRSRKMRCSRVNCPIMPKPPFSTPTNGYIAGCDFYLVEASQQAAAVYVATQYAADKANIGACRWPWWVAVSYKSCDARDVNVQPCLQMHVV